MLHSFVLKLNYFCRKKLGPEINLINIFLRHWELAPKHFGHTFSYKIYWDTDEGLTLRNLT